VAELADYAAKVYAGVVGKIVGVYVGQPIEGWSNERIEREFGEVNWYVSEKLGKPIVVSDDDIAGTLTFIRALADHNAGRDITSEQIGKTWLNYLIEYENTLCWGGLGRLSEHTAFLRLQAGIPAPRSGSMEMNGPWIAEQIGAQIFIDGWAMVAPGDPGLAADLAGRAARVSHDGLAVEAAQAVAAMESLAFIETNMEVLLNCALQHIPHDSIIYALHQDVRQWAAAHGDDWRKTLARIHEKYSGRRFCAGHIIPDHALMVMAWAHAPDSFSKAMTICATAGGDTDCNLGNVGCLMGIKDGIKGLTADGRDWRKPIADRLVLPAAWGATDALREADLIARLGRRVMGWKSVPAPKGGARLHFSMSGALHGFMSEAPDRVTVSGVAVAGRSCLRLDFRDVTGDRPGQISTPTFITPDRLRVLRDCYGGVKYPSLFSGQKMVAQVIADKGNAAPVKVTLFVRYYTDMGVETRTDRAESESISVDPGSSARIAWTVPDTSGLPIYALGLSVSGAPRGTVYLDSLDWSGTPTVRFPDALYRTEYGYPYGWTISGKPNRHLVASNTSTVLIANQGTSLLSTGLATSDWGDYGISAEFVSHADASGIMARYGGLRRYVALLFVWQQKQIQLVRQYDDERTILASVHSDWQRHERHAFRLEVHGAGVAAYADEVKCMDAVLEELSCGGIGLYSETGSTEFKNIEVRPIKGSRS
jgi:ADP-ribosylglycohydrolase